jgi:CubicO group peptidase (beta-lactamase class C family)
MRIYEVHNCKAKYAMVFTLLVLLVLSACTKSVQQSSSLPRSTPEAENISSQSIIDFLDAVGESGQELHSFMILRHGKVVAEGWWDPYKADLKHTLYSTSKSFTSTAIGFAESEKLLSLDDKVISFFPDNLPDTVSDKLESMTIKNLLTMSAGQDPEPTFSLLLPSKNWTGAFLSAPVPNPPGTVFLYNSAATYMLSAIISKLTGETLLNYLKPRLFDPLQIEGMDWEVDPEGINTGGWGLRLKTEDMAKFGQLYLQKGIWNGEQLLPKGWVEEATTKKIDQAPELSEEEKADSDWLQGYCYKFWRSRNNSYRADGAFGQYILVLPEKDVVIAITANASDMQKELNLVWDYILPGISDEDIEPDNDIYNELLTKIKDLKIAPPVSVENIEMEANINGTSWSFQDENTSETFSFNFIDGKCELEIRKNESGSYLFSFGAGEWILGETEKPGVNLLPQPDENFNEMLPFIVAAAYKWTENNTLELFLRFIESPHTEKYILKFDDKEAKLQKIGNRHGDNPMQTGRKVE